ncbi:unnamed protein product [Adineta steineri]|uniref:Uncharacterized protein n=1 Tax=Adineta steineri TaxID=433720 RepID=A0A814DEB1_9BILA|nr:unnamed protein product [Adineta steineri]CAF3635385.1 unnamed protein product [Adineta steineri]
MRLYVSIMKILKTKIQEDLTSILLKLLLSITNLNSLNSIKQLNLFNLFSETYSLQHIPTLLIYYLNKIIHLLLKQDIFALLTDQTLISEQLKLRFQQAVLYSVLPQVSSIDAFVLFLQPLNPKYQHVFPITSNFANLSSLLSCHIAGLGLATHIFAPENRLESLERFCHACIYMNKQHIPTFLSSRQAIEQLVKHDRFDLVDEIIECVDIEIDVTLFERFKCSFDEYQHDLDTDYKELNEAFDTMHQGHQDVLNV